MEVKTMVQMKNCVFGRIRRAICMLTIIMLLTAFQTGCQQASDEFDITIGVILELTGPAAPYGELSKRGLQLAVEDLKTKGVNVNLIIEDGMTDPKSAVSAIEKLITIDKVNAVIATVISSSIMSCAPIAERNQVILFTPGASSPAISDAGDFIFRNRISGLFEVAKAAEVAIEQFDLNRMSMLLVNNEFGRSYGEQFELELEKLGGEIANVDYFLQGESDFRTQLTRLKTVEMDGVFLVGQVAECAILNHLLWKWARQR
jgi:branched-chain amino acid transport system substrate-binding protein